MTLVLIHSLHRFIPVYHSWFFNQDIVLEDGTQLSKEEFSPLLDQDTISQEINISADFPDHLCLSLRVEPQKYEKAVQWLYRLLWSHKFSQACTENWITLLKPKISEFFRDASVILGDLYLQEIYNETYIYRSYSPSQMVKWIPTFEHQLTRNPEEIIRKLQKFEDISTYYTYLLASLTVF